MITSLTNSRVQAAARLHRRRHRQDTGTTIIEGPTSIAAAVESQVKIVDGFYLASDTDSSIALAAAGAVVSEAVLAKVSDTDHPRGPVAVIEIPNPKLSGRDALVLVGVSDPGNAGTLVRTAAAFGFDVVATPDTVDVWSPKVLRAGAGAHFVTNVMTMGRQWLSRISGSGLMTAALVVADGIEPRGLEGGSVALIVGEEASGLPSEVVAAADRRVTIPMPGGTESLNVAIAGAIAMHDRAKTR